MRFDGLPFPVFAWHLIQWTREISKCREKKLCFSHRESIDSRFFVFVLSLKPNFKCSFRGEQVVSWSSSFTRLSFHLRNFSVSVSRIVETVSMAMNRRDCEISKCRNVISGDFNSRQSILCRKQAKIKSKNSQDNNPNNNSKRTNFSCFLYHFSFNKIFRQNGRSWGIVSSEGERLEWNSDGARETMCASTRTGGDNRRRTVSQFIGRW